MSYPLEVIVDIPSTPIYILGNKETLNRILHNLISNAIRYGSQGNMIEITFTDLIKFVLDMVIHSIAAGFISLIPLFYFAIIKRATVTTIICAIVVMQMQNLSVINNFHPELVVLGLTLIGVISVLLSIGTFKRFGRIS